jgi:hypothetical protein
VPAEHIDKGLALRTNLTALRVKSPALGRQALRTKRLFLLAVANAVAIGTLHCGAHCCACCMILARSNA